MGRSKPATIAKRRKKRIEEGLCSNCPNRAVPQRTLCLTCLNKLKSRHIVYKKFKKENNICSKCPNPAISGTTMCQVHLDYTKELRLKKLSNGTCGYCGKEEKMPNKTWCKSCAGVRKQKILKKEELGICTWRIGCKNPATSGKSCDNCKKERCDKLFELKNIVLEHYGQKCNCSCGCKVSNRNHLTIDHINNDGAEQRRASGSNGGHANYRNIIKNNFPEDLQVLCWNCNCAKHFYGGCK